LTETDHTITAVTETDDTIAAVTETDNTMDGNTETGILRRIARGFGGGDNPYNDHTETDDTITAVTDHGDTVQDGPRQGGGGGRRGPRCMIYVNADGNTVEDNTDDCDTVQGVGRRRIARGLGGDGPYTDHMETDDTITVVTDP
jgi:hypothetical protein